jgi:phenylalanyl-tRNA synthetase beta chain
MLVSWNWLKEYVKLDMPVEVLTDRLMMSGLNLESFDDHPETGDILIDLEVTSNRPDCLGHLGIARETSVLFQTELKIPVAAIVESQTPTSSVTSVTIETPELCPRYLARVIRGVKVGPSPDWLVRRLQTIGQPSINNVVDITNYVLFECGQPLHAFDFDKLHGQKIVVRKARPGEKLMAINQKEYELQPEMCVIADADHPVALAGVMGGLETEISDSTRNILIEVAEFAPRSIRATARKLTLHSDSSYRFERGIDPYNLDWASRRCCELILNLAGGELLGNAVEAGIGAPPAKLPVTLRYAQLKRILGIYVPQTQVVRILRDLGMTQETSEEKGTDSGLSVAFVPPTWRRDLDREIDLIEEVARIHGYDQIPQDRPVPLTVSSATLSDRVRNHAADILVGAGFFEAVTSSFVNSEALQLNRPWGDVVPLSVDHSTRVKENLLRQSIIPSLLYVRRQNERHGNFDARLFEYGRAFLHAKPDRTDELAEPELLTIVTEQSYGELKGIVETIAAAINPSAEVTVRASELSCFEAGRGAEVLLNGKPWGWLGEIAADVRNQLGLRDACSAAELRLAPLFTNTNLSPLYQEVPKFPVSERDLNFILDEQVPWQELSEIVKSAAGSNLESLTFVGQYRGQQIAANKKSYVVRLNYRASDRTLTNEEVEVAQQRVIKACTEKLGAALR